jgi:hypothetical protein
MPLPEAIPDDWLKKMHDSRRLALGRKYYYEAKMNAFKRINMLLEVILAFTSTSVISQPLWGLLLSQSGVTIVTAFAAAITAILGVLQPIIRLSEKIDANITLFEAYKRLSDQFDELEFTIQKDKLLTFEEFKKIYALALRGIENSESGLVKLSNYHKRIVEKDLPVNHWKISYISPQKTLQSLEDLGRS